MPGIETLSFTLAISAAGLDELSVTVGPAPIDAGGVMLRPFVTRRPRASPLRAAGAWRSAWRPTTRITSRRAGCSTPASFDLVASDGRSTAAIDSTDPAQVALRIVEVVADLVAAVAMAQQPVQDLLDTEVGDEDVRNLLQGVVLRDVAEPGRADRRAVRPADAARARAAAVRATSPTPASRSPIEGLSDRASRIAERHHRPAGRR